MKSKSIKIYVDTNVLVNYCTGQQADVDALTYIFSKRRRETLFTSSLAIVQTITQLQKSNKSRKAFDRASVVELMNKLMAKFSVIDLSKNDLSRGFAYENKDVEDSIHYVLCEKLKCDTILTNNLSDFDYFKKIKKISPAMGLTLIKMKIK
jgi:predicted nucleic acid-binding protein